MMAAGTVPVLSPLSAFETIGMRCLSMSGNGALRSYVRRYCGNPTNGANLSACSGSPWQPTARAPRWFRCCLASHSQNHKWCASASAFAAALTHPIEEVRWYATWGIDGQFWAVDPVVALRCVNAIATEAALIDQRWEAEKRRPYPTAPFPGRDRRGGGNRRPPAFLARRCDRRGCAHYIGHLGRVRGESERPNACYPRASTE